MISIIIPVYNGAKTLETTLKSIAAQTWTDFEVIIVDDASRDGTQKVFENFISRQPTENYYHYLRQVKNAGAPAARNRAYLLAQGDFLFFCDADAKLRPEALSKLKQALDDNPAAAYAYSSFYWGRKLFKLWPFDEERLKKMPYIHTMALIRREAFPASGWDESLKKLQDWDLWLSLMEAGHRGVFVPEVLFKIKPGGQISSWLPAAAYKLFPFLPAVRKYQQAMEIIKKKHNLN